MNKFFKQYLTEESRNLILGVNVFQDFEDKKYSSVYAGEFDYQSSTKCIDQYLFIIRDIRNWLGVVLALDMLENRKESASAVIYLPTQDVEVKVGRDSTGSIPEGRKKLRYNKPLWDMFYEDVADKCRDIPYFERHTEKPVKTPVGIMDGFVLEALLGVGVNPITKAYEVFESLDQKIHNLLSERGAAEDVVLSDEVLTRYHIHDTLGVYKFDSMYGVINKFLKNGDNTVGSKEGSGI